ncbi:MAG: PAS domain S-box protein [Euryarchaeota archaeon]|nr:PAS domain S-box protein [Euryarchaeota archaeon]
MCLAVSMIPIGIIGGIQGFQSKSIMLIGLIAVVTFVTSIIVSYLISRSIENLTKNIDEISRGKLDVELEKSEIYEINKLTDSLNRVMASLKLAIHKVGVKKGEIFERSAESVKEKYNDLLNSMTGWAWETDNKGVYTFCSKNVADTLGYQPEEVIGKSIFDLMSSEEVENTKQIFDESIKNKMPIKNLENWHTSKNGKKICIVTNGVPFFDETGNLCGYRGIDIDITANKDVEEKIKTLNAELTDLKKEITQLLNKQELNKINVNAIDSIKNKLEEKWSEHEFDSVFLFDENAKILDCNENVHKKIGYTKSEMLSLNMADFDALESKEDIISKINDAKKTGSITFKTIHKRKDGSAILVHENVQYLKDKNVFKCIVREDYPLK